MLHGSVLPISFYLYQESCHLEQRVQSLTINIYAVESQISKELGLLQKKYQKKIDIGSYPFFRLGKIGVSIVLRSELKIVIKKVEKELKKIIHRKRLKIFKL